MLPWSFLLLLGTILICTIPGETAVYYFTPTESSVNPNDCPGRPCHTLDYYFCVQRDRYFNSTVINVTMILQPGKHNFTDCNDFFNRIIIKDMEVFEMIGNGPAEEVVVNLATSLLMINVSTSYFGNLKFMALEMGYLPSVDLFGYSDDYSEEQTNSGESKHRNNKTFVTVVNGTFFSHVIIVQKEIIGRRMNFKVTVINSTFTNWSGILASLQMIELDSDYTRQLEVKQCTFNNSSIIVDAYVRANVTINDFTSSGESLISLVLYYGSVTIAGNVTFAGFYTPIITYSSTVTLSGSISFVNNTGTNGGAMALYSSTLNIASNTTVHFINNTATDTGGALYVSNGKNIFIYEFVPCFYQLLDYGDESNWYDIQFENNSAANGGDNIYGESMHSCTCYAVNKISDGSKPAFIPTYCVQKEVFSYHPHSISSVSSNPTRACLCNHGQPQCDMFHHDIEVHPGEPFTLSAVIVGADLGTTIGAIYTVLGDHSSSVVLTPSTQAISNTSVCTELQYTIYSRIEEKYQEFYFTIRPESLKNNKKKIRVVKSKDSLCTLQVKCDSDHILDSLLHTPPLVSITLLACPRGFTLLGSPLSCRCYPVLTENDVDCKFKDGVGYQMWNSSKWFDIDTDMKVYMAQYCPFGYCISNEKVVNFQDNSSAQCLFDRQGRLCGSCKENFSLAIGSSHCVHCPNNNNLALLIFFAAAGFLLVFFISVMNLTVTQGTINGLIFYANIFWSYQNILLPQVDTNYFLAFLRVFIAWLNLDFGIQACFFKGLNAFWKTWLQYLFPLYIWSIAGLVIVGAKYSSKLTKLFGNRTVSVLATLFLLSYTKLLKVIIDSLGFTPIQVFGNNTNNTFTVWSLDGHYLYGHFPHILLVIAALTVFTFMWLPFTLALFLMQWLRRISDFKLLKWISRLKPVFDTYFAPLKDKHHYWFGVLLIVRGALLGMFTTTYAIYPKINYFLVLMTSALLLCYSNYHRVYKNKAVQFNENLFLVLLVFVGGSGSLEEKTRHTVAYASIIIGILGLFGIICRSKLLQIYFQKRGIWREYVVAPPPQVLPEISRSVKFRDSILNETKKLIEDT